MSTVAGPMRVQDRRCRYRRWFRGGFGSKLALGSAATLGLYLATLGLATPDSCTWTPGVAGAAPAPSPSCGGDLRECLRKSADIRQTTFGGRYVTAEDVARCTEIFNNCIHMGAARGGIQVPPGSRPPPSAEVGGTDRTTSLPQHFGITEGDSFYDCRRSGDAVSCDQTLTKPFGTTDTLNSKVTGTLSGLTMTGSFKGHQTGHSPADPSCRYEQDLSGSATYVFSPDGTVALRYGPPQIEGTHSCSGSTSFTGQAWESTGTWSAME